MKKVLLTVFLFLSAFAFVFSQSQSLVQDIKKNDNEGQFYKLSVEDAVALALENNISIKMYYFYKRNYTNLYIYVNKN